MKNNLDEAESKYRIKIEQENLSEIENELKQIK